MSCELSIESSTCGLGLSVFHDVTFVVFVHLTLCALFRPNIIQHFVFHLKPMVRLMNIVKSFQIVYIMCIPICSVTRVSNTTWNCYSSIVRDSNRTTYCSAFQKASLVRNCSCSPAWTISGVSPSIHLSIRGSTGPSVLSIQRPQPQ